MPFFVVPNDLPVFAFSASWSPSTCWWKSNTKWALSDTIKRFCQSWRPFASFFDNSSKSPGKCITTPLPEKGRKNNWSVPYNKLSTPPSIIDDTIICWLHFILRSFQRALYFAHGWPIQFIWTAYCSIICSPETSYLYLHEVRVSWVFH